MKLFYKVNAMFCVILSVILLIPMFLLDIPYILLRLTRQKLVELGADNFIKAYGMDEVLRLSGLNKVKKDSTL